MKRTDIRSRLAAKLAAQESQNTQKIISKLDQINALEQQAAEYYDRREHDGAIKSFLEMLRLIAVTNQEAATGIHGVAFNTFPTTVNTHYMLGKCFSYVDDATNAELHFANAQKLNPNYRPYDIAYYRGVNCYKAGNSAEAKKQFLFSIQNPAPIIKEESYAAAFCELACLLHLEGSALSDEETTAITSTIALSKTKNTSHIDHTLAEIAHACVTDSTGYTTILCAHGENSSNNDEIIVALFIHSVILGSENLLVVNKFCSYLERYKEK